MPARSLLDVSAAPSAPPAVRAAFLSVKDAAAYLFLADELLGPDGRVLAEAATAVETLWPAILRSEPPTGGSDSRVLPLDLEPGGWFDTVARPAAEEG